MTRTLSVAALFFMAVPGLAAAQEAPKRFDAARPIAPAAVATPATITATAPVATTDREPAEVALEESARRQGSTLGTVLHTLGGALVGGWVGYVGSQVTLSDWDKETNGSFSGERTAWVAGGMVVGILGSRLIGRTYAPDRPQIDVRRPRADRNILTRAEIESSGASDVYQLVSSIRKDWLVPRGVNSLQESARGRSVSRTAVVVQPGQPNVMVYMNDIRIGGVEEMREIPIQDIMEIRFIGPQEAVYRYGSGHSHGVILLKTTL